MRCNFTSFTSSNSNANLWEGLRLPIVSWINSWWNLGLRDQMLDKVVMTRSRAIDQMVLSICTYRGEQAMMSKVLIVLTLQAKNKATTIYFQT